MMGQGNGSHRERQSRHLDALAVVLERYGLDAVRRYEEPSASPFLRVMWPDMVLGDTITVAGPGAGEEGSWVYRASLGTSLGSCVAPEEAAWVIVRRLSPHMIARTLEEELSACRGCS